ncbi:MAG: leucine--tRNA ligase [Planctomycetes bacterium]|nr:leucine--tRNA ligase [Planctomycetota bacterium]
MADYDFRAFERRWQARWDELRLFQCDTAGAAKPPSYCLMMFPYPSGDLHVGHGRNYLIGDTLVRHKLMQGYEVLSPMGWDAFGLPAENAAIKRNIHPAEWTRRNIAAMKDQLTRWGVGYDWRRELATCDPGYYKWTQWVFCRLFDAGLVYRKKAAVNWCPDCSTVLANEQVVDGRCERCGHEVARRELEQWFVKITDYAQRLLDDLEKLPRWPEQVKNIQRARIGRSQGALVDFTVAETGDRVTCFTTRPDTLWGVTYFCVAAEHPLVDKALERADPEKVAELEALRAAVKKQSTVEREKTKLGAHTGLHVVNPVNGERVPLFVANYVLMEYGTGAVMAVPAHDQRDFEFARAQKLPIRVVISPPGKTLDPAAMTEAWAEDGLMTASGPFDGTPTPAGIDKVIAWLEEKGLGKGTVQFKLHDWCISRQRYWGAPVPIVHCPACGPVRVPTEQLPVELPTLEDFRPKGRSVLESVDSFMQTTCPTCAGPARRDPDTLDTFVDSAWYYLRYPNPDLADRPFDKATVDRWLPVHQYVGGREHASGHLLYSRFIVKALHDLGELGFDEPFGALFCQGMIGMQSYRCEQHGWVSWKEVTEREGPGGKKEYVHGTCPPLQAEYFKMSKTRLNLVSASDMAETWGVDVQRLYTMAVGPAEQDAEWIEQGVVGYSKFLRRALATVEALGRATAGAGPVDPGALSPAVRDVRRKAHETIVRVSSGLELDREGNFGFHTAISAMIELEHAFPAEKDLGDLAAADAAGLREAATIFVKLLAPFAPHLAEELWHAHLGGQETVFRQAWPAADAQALVRDEVEIAVQIQGKPRAKAMVPPEADEEALRRIVLELPRVKEELQGKTVRKFIVVKKQNVNNLVNIVAG